MFDIQEIPGIRGITVLNQWWDRLKEVLRRCAKMAGSLCVSCRHSPYKQLSYSQDGEDRVIAHLFEGQRRGFYVDVGAHHPKRFSNTYLFCEKGWKGLAIDPTPGVAKLFQTMRPRDQFLEVGIAAEPGEKTFFMYDEPAFNTFNETSHQIFEERGYPKLQQSRKIPVRPLSDVLEESLPKGQEIDLLSIDVEGLDFQVLQSNDWTRFRPKAIVVELGSDIESTLREPAHHLLVEQGYRFQCKTTLPAIYVRKDLSA